MTHHTTDPQRGAGLRVTREQVEAAMAVEPTWPELQAICRDWLDMRDRLAAAERVVAVVRSEYPDSAWQVWSENFAKHPDDVTDVTHARRLIKAVLAYDATTHSTEASIPASEEDRCE